MGRHVVVVFAALAAVACTKPNPDFCCTTLESCQALGVDELRTCPADQVCIGAACLPGACASAADCANPTPICEASLRECRGCTADLECGAGQYCLAAIGECVAAADVAHVRNSGFDVGDCPPVAPCSTIGYGLDRSARQLPVVRIVGSPYFVTSTVTLQRSAYIDGAGARIEISGAQLSVSGAVDVTIADVTIAASTPQPIFAALGARVMLSAVEFQGPAAAVTGIQLDASAEVRITESTLRQTYVDCTNGTLDIRRSTLDHAYVRGSGCALDAVQNSSRWSTPFTAYAMTGGRVRIENNLFVNELRAQAVTASGGLGDSYIRHNTLVRLTLGVEPAMTCTGAVAITSNVIAWRATAFGAGSTCTVGFSLLDIDAGSVPGQQNTNVPIGEIFQDAGSGDYRPSATSAARGAAEDGLGVTEDLVGQPRPQPIGTAPDIGAYEVP